MPVTGTETRPMEQQAPPCILIIFGAAGDLTQRLLVPSICNLSELGLLNEETQIIGADHNERDATSWRKELEDALHDSEVDIGEDAWSSLAERFDYIKFDFKSDADYEALAKRLNNSGNIIFYFAVAPRFFESLATGLARVGLLREESGAFRRMVVEKPFGRDVESAQKLNRLLKSVAAERQIFRIDHFLGKDAVQGILALRFGTRAFEPLLNRDHVANVQITAAETIGVEDRGAFYDTIGALRDMVPNHLFSLLTLIAMDEPRAFETQAMRNAKTDLLNAIRPVEPSHAARGQYASGTLDGKAALAYRDEDRVARESKTETYAALAAFIDNDRWRGVPFYVRTGKRMRAHVTTIAVTLRRPSGLFKANDTDPHLLLFGIDPQRGLVERFAAKPPGVDLRLERAHMGFRYEAMFEKPASIGYESLLFDVMCGQEMSFQSDDMIEREWAILSRLIQAWSDDPSVPESYAPGSDGPRSADSLLKRNGDQWLDIEPLDSLGTGPSSV